jgi:hypothetical protein
MDLTIKRIPDSVYKVIKREAQSQGRSLNAEVIRTLEAEAAELERRRKWKTLRKELEQFVESLPPSNNSVALIRQNRNR